MFPYYFIRFSGPVLFVLVGVKILSGYGLTEGIPAATWLAGLHQNRALDLVLLLLFIFHGLYGFRLFLIDLGMMRHERALLWVSSLVAAITFAFSYFYFFRSSSALMRKTRATVPEVPCPSGR